MQNNRREEAMLRRKRRVEGRNEPYYKRPSKSDARKQNVLEEEITMDQTLDMKNQYCERRHQPCEKVTKLGGQVNILKWIFGITVSIILIIGAGLWARTDSLKDEIVNNNLALTKMISDLTVEVTKINGNYNVIDNKLDNIAKQVDEAKRLSSFNQNLIKGIK